ncbi:MAG: hypothetical protein CMJ48_01870, partial [Planctomycetaceae bacterium]|nr:hypothetical protein [Planctomycetaceae bacterium]
MKLHRSLALFLAATAIAAGAARSASADPIDVSVLTYNVQICIFFCGGHYQDIADVIAASGANVVGLQEDNNGASSVANRLGAGWNFHDFGNGNGNLNSFDTSILTRFPITDSFSDGIEILLPNGLNAYVWVVHLEPYPYQPYDIGDGSITTADKRYKLAFLTTGKYQYVNKTKIAGNLSRS